MPHRSRNILRRDAKLAHHRGQLILQLGGIGELLPFERPAQQTEAILVGRLRDFQPIARSPEHRAERRIHLRRQRQRHGDGLAFRPRKVLQMFLGEALEQALQLARESRSARPTRHTPRSRRRRCTADSLCARTPASSTALPVRPRRTACTSPRAGRALRCSAAGACGCRSCPRRRAARPTPDEPFGAGRQHRRSGSFAPVIGQRGVARQRYRIGRCADGPGMLSAAGHNRGGRFGRPADVRRIAQRSAQILEIGWVGFGRQRLRRADSRRRQWCSNTPRAAISAQK